MLAGTFNTLFAPEFPGFYPNVWVYVTISDVEGPIDLSIVFTDLDEDKVLLRGELTAMCEGRLANHEIVLQLPGLPMLREGSCSLEVLHDEVALGSLRLQIKKHLPPPTLNQESE